ncbi:MAG: polysaccharide deacetylase family protein [Saprospiraceae bacterium]|nr:polysaccharide deacetylase family protein [Saprospiraceae bacterium]
MGGGKMVISLDFELYWGVTDSKSIDAYQSNILGVQSVIPKLLHLFDQYQIKATFAIVGFLFCHNKKELLEHLPKTLPKYKNKKLSPYKNQVEKMQDDDLTQPYYFAPELIRLIKNHSQHEIATHTFSHYYCLEPGQQATDFFYDLEAALKIASEYQVNITSIVFPRNQYNKTCINLCEELGIQCYRGNPKHWIYQADVNKTFLWIKKGIRLLDHYINITGHHCYERIWSKYDSIKNIQASRFLRPYTPSLSWIESIRLQRILSSMTHAAKNNLTFHLWWHPHNFGIHQQANFKFLESILKHYQYLNVTYQFSSCTMAECARSQQ